MEFAVVYCMVAVVCGVGLSAWASRDDSATKEEPTLWFLLGSLFGPLVLALVSVSVLALAVFLIVMIIIGITNDKLLVWHMRWKRYKEQKMRRA